MADIVLGMGEVGSTIFGLVESRGHACVGIDVDPSRSRAGDATGVDFLHVCIPGGLEAFQEMVLEHARTYRPNAILIHSTVRPGTAAALQAKTEIPVVSAPARGVHHRFMQDMVRYTKFVACDIEPGPKVVSGIEGRFVKVAWMSSTKAVELAKILTDTTYYGWLINYAQITAMICQREGIDYDEMWTFADEIHRYLGNRPKMFPGIIGGHCVIPNLSLIDYEELQAVQTINEIFREHKGQDSP
ncbi:MAG: GDP-mannose dehydrogenase [Nitrosopumilaceae archaeon]|nr:GDP-mannose dehydrogenase [Nitrosopumilaceae archaeon]